MATITEPYSDLKKKYVRLMKDEKSKCISFEKYLKQIIFLKIKVALSPYLDKLYSNCQLHGFFFSRPKTNL